MIPVRTGTFVVHVQPSDQCCGAGAGGAATFCWSRSESFFGPAPEPGL
jgi:hypothetical protein